jgi:hypothetical protein
VRNAFGIAPNDDLLVQEAAGEWLVLNVFGKRDRMPAASERIEIRYIFCIVFRSGKPWSATDNTSIQSKFDGDAFGG